MPRYVLVLYLLCSFSLCLTLRGASIALDGDWHFLADPAAP